MTKHPWLIANEGKVKLESYRREANLACSLNRPSFYARFKPLLNVPVTLRRLRLRVRLP